MATIRAPLRHLTSLHPRVVPIRAQRRWAQVHDVRFLATTQQRLRILEKYRDKLDRKAREEGHESIDSLKAAYSEKITQLRRQADTIINPGAAQPPPPPPTPTAAPSVRAAGPPKPSSESAIKPLSSILNLEKVAALPPTELTAIWRLRHAANPQSLCAVVPTDTYTAMETTARQFPQFLLPVPHPEQGAEMHFLQWTWDAATRSSTVLFTQLAEYKARGEFATPHTTVTHYTDLKSDKGVVLMQGTVADDRGVKVEDARWLVMCLQRFYGGWQEEKGEERRELLEWFGKGDARFSVERLMEVAERMG
ncbi:hypothetical protein OQA88_1595 [Cercophora sp. LCS_1]